MGFRPESAGLTKPNVVTPMSDLPPCPFCHSSDVKLLRTHAIVIILVCNKCGFQFSEPPPKFASDAGGTPPKKTAPKR